MSAPEVPRDEQNPDGQNPEEEEQSPESTPDDSTEAVAETAEPQPDTAAGADRKSSRRRFRRESTRERRARAVYGGSGTSDSHAPGGRSSSRRPVFVAIAILATLAVGAAGLVMGVLGYVKADEAKDETTRLNDVFYVEEAIRDAEDANRGEAMKESFKDFVNEMFPFDSDEYMGMGKDWWDGRGSGWKGWWDGRGRGWKKMPGMGFRFSMPGVESMPGADIMDSMPGKDLEGDWDGWKEDSWGDQDSWGQEYPWEEDLSKMDFDDLRDLLRSELDPDVLQDYFGSELVIDDLMDFFESEVGLEDLMAFLGMFAPLIMSGESLSMTDAMDADWLGEDQDDGHFSDKDVRGSSNSTNFSTSSYVKS